MRARVNERSVWEYRTTLLKTDDSPVTLAELLSLTLTLTNKLDGTVINSRNAVSVKNANGGTFGNTDGLFVMAFTSLDSPIVTAGVFEERHIALFEATWAGGGAFNWEVEVDVRNLNNVP